jgi:hypothetical protein
MQLIFKRKDEKLSIEIKDGVSTIEFNYVEMIKKFLKEKELEETIFEGDFSDDEKGKINEMVKKINMAIPNEDELEINENK